MDTDTTRFYRVRIGAAETLAIERDGVLRRAPWSVGAGLTGELREELGRVDDIEVLSPVRPGKVVAIGLNYRDHIAETGAEPPGSPLVFAKFPSAVIGARDPIVVDPRLVDRADWEVELAVVIGRKARSVSVDEALDFVFGYCAANDVSARDVQFADGQWTRGKSFDTFCPLGPCVVGREAIPDPQDLTLRTWVNGELMQEASTSLMLFSVAELIAFCSSSFTLEPGDVLLTGTPWGCGEFMEPKRSLAAGDLVEVEAEGIGALRNPVVGPAGQEAP